MTPDYSLITDRTPTLLTSAVQTAAPATPGSTTSYMQVMSTILTRLRPSPSPVLNGATILTTDPYGSPMQPANRLHPFPLPRTAPFLDQSLTRQIGG